MEIPDGMPQQASTPQDGHTPNVAHKKTSDSVDENTVHLNMDYNRQSFAYMDMSDVVFIGCNFNEATFIGQKVVDCVFIDCCFDNAEMIHVDLSRTTFRNCSFSGTELHGLTTEMTMFGYCVFELTDKMVNAGWYDATFVWPNLMKEPPFISIPCPQNPDWAMVYSKAMDLVYTNQSSYVASFCHYRLNCNMFHILKLAISQQFS